MDNFSHWFWQIGIQYFLYLILFLVAIWTSKNIMLTSIQNKYKEMNYKYRIRKVRNKVEFSNSTSYKNPFLMHLNLLVKTTREERNEHDVPVFIVLSLFMGIFSALFILITFGDILVSVLFGMLLSMIPYLILRLRLNKIRYLMGQEFLHIVQRLTQNYNAMHYDMYHALSETQKEIKSPVLRKVIVKLISDLQVSRNDDELRDSIRIFTYTAGTNWSKRLGSVILKAYMYNEKVLNALMVLTKQMEDTEEMLEEEKSETLDSVFNGYLTLPLFLGSLVLGYYSSGAQDWTKLQFGSQWTLFLFAVCVLGVTFSIIISIFLKRPKNDL
ncbi:hypothetical protein AWM68_17890 [Fictibacillus phosphorivorans]|uniref:Type II secretion system protein GspF domain-containing protein n=1 Tax=Fictibacillus phosphorivorans TaxID=1221500 RepID=A0A163S381_9BACL|nr:hypothetical protein [Fictibacillus phosphorivorans]KZE68042.1 hypothetical protein AWM68_17890 [Fictibacillus phosphorivorans]